MRPAVTNPGSIDGGRKYREASEMLRAAVHSPVGGRGKHRKSIKLRRICDKIAARAMAGEPWACCLVFDRLDGKAHQSVDSTVTLEAGAVFVDLLRALQERRAAQQQVAAHKPGANGGMIDVTPQSTNDDQSVTPQE